MPYHVRISTKTGMQDEVRLDLTEQELEDRFLRPYREGRPIVIGGTTVSPQELERIRINQTDMEASQILPIVKAQLARNRVISPLPDDWRIAAYGVEVTDKFITAPPGEAVILDRSDEKQGEKALNPRRVFVVHGRNAKARDAMFTFLRALSLEPVEWNEAVAATGKPVPYIGEILDVAFEQAAAILVLMTPDDEAKLRDEYRGQHEPPHETTLTGQARANVIFEAGMAIGRDANRTVLVEMGNLRPFSDIGGRHVIRMDSTTQRRQELAQRLLGAGCSVNLSGLDWHTAGDFAACL